MVPLSVAEYEKKSHTVTVTVVKVGFGYGCLLFRKRRCRVHASLRRCGCLIPVMQKTEVRVPGEAAGYFGVKCGAHTGALCGYWLPVLLISCDIDSGTFSEVRVPVILKKKYMSAGSRYPYF